MQHCTGCLHYNKVYTTKYGINSFKYQVPVQHVLDVYTTTKFIQPNMVYTHLKVPVQHVLDVYTTTKFIQPNMVYTHLKVPGAACTGCLHYNKSLYNQIW